MAEESMGGDHSETDGDADRYQPGTVVVDREDPEPTEAVAINRPPCTCEEWVAYLDSETEREVTVAEDNPEYEGESDVIVVAFRESLEEQDSEKLPVKEPIPLAELNCKHYGFPKGRLQIVDDTSDSSPSKTDTEADDQETGSNHDEQGNQNGVGESDEENGSTETRELSPELRALRDRLTDSATVTVEWDGVTPRLSVEKLGTTYEISPDGTIEGDEALRDQFRPLVDEYLNVDN